MVFAARMVFTQYLIPQIVDSNGRVRRAVMGLVADVAAVEPSIVDSSLIDALRERFRDPSMIVRKQCMATVEALLRHHLATVRAASSNKNRDFTKQTHVLVKLYLETVPKLLFDSDQSTRDAATNSMESFILLPMSSAKFRFPDLQAGELQPIAARSWIDDADANTQLAWYMCCVIARDASGDMLRCFEEAVEEWGKDRSRKGPRAKKVDQFNSLLMKGAKWLAETTMHRNNSMPTADGRSIVDYDEPAFYTSALSQEISIWCLLALMSSYDTPNTLKCGIALDFLFSNRKNNDENDALAVASPNRSFSAHDHHLQQLPHAARNAILGHVLQFIIRKARSLSRTDAERYRDEMKANFNDLADCDSSHICSAIRCMRALCESASGRTQSYEYSDGADSRNVTSNQHGSDKGKKNAQVDVEFFRWARHEAYACTEILGRWLEASPYLASSNSSSHAGTRPSSPVSSRTVKKHASLPLPSVEQVVRALRALAEFLTHSIHVLKSIKRDIQNAKDMKDTISKKDGDDKQYLVEVIAVMCHFNSPPATTLLSQQHGGTQKFETRTLSSRAPSMVFKKPSTSRVTSSYLTPEIIAKYHRKVDACYEVRANALLALGRLCLLSKDWAVAYAPEFVNMLLDTRADDGLRCTCLQVLMDLYKRHSDTVERYLPRMTQCIGDANASTRLRETAVQNLQHMLRADLLRYDGQFIFEVLAALPAEAHATNREFARSVEAILTTLADTDQQKWLNIFLRAVLFFNGYTHHTKFDDALRAQVNAAKQQPSSSSSTQQQQSTVFKLAGDSNRKRRRIILQFMLIKMRDFSKLMLIPRVMDELVLPACNSELVLDESLTAALIDIFELMSTEKNMKFAALARNQGADGELAAAVQPEGDAAAGAEAAALMAEIADDEQTEKRKIDEEKLRAQIETTLREICLHRVVPVLASFNSIVRIKSDPRLHRSLLKYTKFVVDSPMMCCKPEDFDEALLMTPGLDRAQVSCFRQDLKKYGREAQLRKATHPNEDESGSDTDDDVKNDVEGAASSAATTQAVPESQANAAAIRHPRRTLLEIPSIDAAVSSSQTRGERQKALDEKRRRTRTDLAQMSLHGRTLMGGASLSASAMKKQQVASTSPTASPVVEKSKRSGRQFVSPLPPPAAASTPIASARKAADVTVAEMEDADENESTITSANVRGRTKRDRAGAIAKQSAVEAAESNTKQGDAVRVRKNKQRRAVLEEDSENEGAQSVTPTPQTAFKPPNAASSRTTRTRSTANVTTNAENSRAARRHNTGSTSGEDVLPQRAVSTPKRAGDVDADSAMTNGSASGGGKKAKGSALPNPLGDLTFNADISGIKNVTLRSTRRRH